MTGTFAIDRTLSRERATAAAFAILVVVLAFAAARGLLEPGLAMLAAGGLVLASCYLLLAATLSSKEVAVVATMATLSAAGRVAFAAIPSVQPSTVLVIISGYVFGPGAGFLVGATTALVSNFFLGQGPWTIWQMLAWGAVGASAGLLGRIVGNIGAPLLAVFAAAAGLVFSALMNVWFWLSFVYPHTAATLGAAFATSLWFDILHAVGNVVFALLIGPRAIKILAGFKSRFHVTYGGTHT